MNARASLIAAAPALAAECRLVELTADAVCRKSGVDAEVFAASFGDVTGYLIAVQQGFMDRLRDRIVAVTAGVPPGLRRIQLATESYLSGCLKERTLRTWLLEARMRPTVLASLRRQNQTYTVILGAELDGLGWPDGVAAARLIMAMISAASIVEHRTGVQPELRAALWHFLEHGG
jgi:AcrR family transcriptional regulator